MTRENYYKAIAEHYDREAALYEQRLQTNQTLKIIRDDFRQVVIEFIQGRDILDFGCGAGSDICFFAAQYPEKSFTGMDLSSKMIEHTHDKIINKKLSNVKLSPGTLDDLSGQTFDFIYVFFGALNTVPDLDETAAQLEKYLNSGGRILITFVNKWYPMGMLAYLRRLNFKKAFERLRKTWWGYSENYLLRSRTYYGWQIKRSFKNFNLLFKRGYSILYPAWFQDRIRIKLGPFAEKLWHLDTYLSKTFFWSWGDYVLLVFEKDSDK